MRAALEAETAEPGGVARAYERLRAADPTPRPRIDPHNARRIVRALEVIDDHRPARSRRSAPA